MAALAASAHRRRRDLAADVGTKTGILFPRAGRHTEQADATGDDTDSAPEAPDYVGSDALQVSAEPVDG